MPMTTRGERAARGVQRALRRSAGRTTRIGPSADWHVASSTSGAGSTSGIASRRIRLTMFR